MYPEDVPEPLWLQISPGNNHRVLMGRGGLCNILGIKDKRPLPRKCVLCELRAITLQSANTVQRRQAVPLNNTKTARSLPCNTTASSSQTEPVYLTTLLKLGR